MRAADHKAVRAQVLAKCAECGEPLGVLHAEYGCAVPVDIRVENHGSLFLLRPLSDAALDWLDEHTDEANRSYWTGALVVEPRYVEDIVNGAREAGLEVR